MTGTHTFVLYADEFYQRHDLIPVREYQGGPLLGHHWQLTSFENHAISPAVPWADSTRVGEYYIQYRDQYSLSDSQDSVCDSTLMDDSLVFDTWTWKQQSKPGASPSEVWVQFQITFVHQFDDFALTLYYRAYADGVLERWSRFTVLPEANTLYVRGFSGTSRTFDRTAPSSPDSSVWMVERVRLGTYARYRDNAVRNTFGWTHSNRYILRQDDYTAEEPRRGEALLFTLDQSPFGSYPCSLSLIPKTAQPVRLCTRAVSRYATLSTEEDYLAGRSDSRVTLPVPVPPGMFLEWPHALMCFSDTTLMNASLAFSDLSRNHRKATIPSGVAFPPVSFETYFWSDFDYDVDQLDAQAAICSDLGVEWFVIDANWNKYSLKRVDSWTGVDDPEFEVFRRGNGYWVSDDCRFQEYGRSLASFINDRAQAIHDLQVGLWVYPASVDTTLLLNEAVTPCWGAPSTGDPCFSSLSEWELRSAWTDDMYTAFCAAGGDHWVRGDQEQETECFEPELETDPHLGEICMADSAGASWVEAQMKRLISSTKYDCAYLRFDGGRHPCVSTEHTHSLPQEHRVIVPEDGHELMLEHLRAARSDLLIETGWPQGHLTTLEDPAAIEDWRPHDSRFSMEAARTVLPMEHTAGFLYREPNVDGMNGAETEAYRKYWVRSALLGPVFLSDDLVNWSTGFATIVRNEITRYKSDRRFLMGDAYNVLLQRSFGPGTAPTEYCWDAVEFFDPDPQHLDAVLFVFHGRVIGNERNIALQALNPNQEYLVESYDSNFTPYTAYGDSLMGGGVHVELEQLSSDVIYITPN